MIGSNILTGGQAKANAFLNAANAQANALVGGANAEAGMWNSIGGAIGQGAQGIAGAYLMAPYYNAQLGYMNSLSAPAPAASAPAPAPTPYSVSTPSTQGLVTGPVPSPYWSWGGYM